MKNFIVGTIAMSITCAIFVGINFIISKIAGVVSVEPGYIALMLLGAVVANLIGSVVLDIWEG
jgi:hypothetical protein